MSASLVTVVAERLALGANSAAELMQALGVSQTTVSKALRVLERSQRVLRMGSTRGARYALRRRVAAIGLVAVPCRSRRASRQVARTDAGRHSGTTPRTP